MKERYLQVYSFLATAALVIVLVVAAKAPPKTAKFTEIDVERINVRDANGRLRLVLANGTRLPKPFVAGEELPRNSTAPGILFYNEGGDEVGGLMFAGRKKDGVVDAFASLTFDQYQQDQTLQLSYSDENNYRLVGLRVKDRPDLPLPEHSRRLAEVSKMPDGPAKTAAMAPLLAPDRVFVGKSGKNAAVWLLDAKGNPRIKLMVDGDGNPRLDFLDAKGNVIQRLPFGVR